MIAELLPLLVALAVQREADPCAPLEALPPDPQGAADYRGVGEAELQRGNRETAALAFRAAASRDPGDARSREALARLCERSRAQDPFAAGVQRMEAGDLRGAIEAFRELRGDPSAALLEGICHHDLGDDSAAVPLLRIAEASPPHRELARLYLGLAALRAGGAGEAASLFDAASASPSIARIGADLARLARREGRLVVSILAESAWDSNVNLAPSDPLGAPRDDASGGLLASVLLRPTGARGPYLRASADLHEQVSLGGYDFGALDVAAGWQARLGRLSLAGEYDYGERTLGGAFFLSAHRLLASAALQRGALVVSATYSVRLEDYGTGWDAFSGTLHRAEAKVSFPLGDRARLALVYGAGADLADEDVASFLEHGPRGELRVALGARTRLGVEVAATFRGYESYDAALVATRRDTALDLAALGELDLTARLTLRLSIAARHVASNVASLEYDRIVPAIGLSWTAGIW